jgi:hypothetical protein
MSIKRNLHIPLRYGRRLVSRCGHGRLETAAVSEPHRKHLVDFPAAEIRCRQGLVRWFYSSPEGPNSPSTLWPVSVPVDRFVAKNVAFRLCPMRSQAYGYFSLRA